MSTASASFLDTFEIGGTGALADEAAWDIIAGVVSCNPVMGTKWAQADSTAFGDSVRQNVKTIRDPDTLTLVMNRIAGDDGQTQLQTAADDADAAYDYNFRYKRKNGSGTTLETYTFKGRVMSFVGGAPNPGALHQWRADIEIVTAFTVA